jgi:hypoxanthine-guanine phosphoribosyltransferase
LLNHNGNISFYKVDWICKKLFVKESQDSKNVLSVWDLVDSRKVFIADIPAGTVHLEVKAFRVVHFLNKTDRRRQNIENTDAGSSDPDDSSSRTVFETVAEFYDFWSSD